VEAQFHGGILMKSAVDIVALYEDRVRRLGPVHNQMRQVRSLADGDVVLPLNELDRNARSSVANLLVQGLDQMAARVASVMPQPYFPPLKETEKAKRDARTRKQALLSWWDRNTFDLKMSIRSRHLLAYSQSPVSMEPCFKRMIPMWRVQNPLDVFTAPVDQADEIWPDDAIIAWEVTAKYLLTRYPQVKGRLYMGDYAPDSRFLLLRWMDDMEMVTVVKGSTQDDEPMAGHWPSVGSLDMMELERVPNRAGVPLVVMPQRLTLNRPRGQFDGMLNMFYTRARLQALNEIAIERGIFPDEYLVARPGEVPEIIQVADGRRGELGMVKGGTIERLEVNPGYKTDTALDRIERQERLEGAIPPEFGGESGSNIRTGRRGDSILSATIDFRVLEAQRLFEKSIAVEDKIAIAIDKAYFGSAPKSFIMPGRAKAGAVDYVPNKLWEIDEHLVTYPAAGADINNLVIGIGQRVGIGTMSKESARESDPLIGDPELEHDRITSEAVESALLASIQQQAAMPDGPYQPRDLAALVKKVTVENKSLYQAIEEVDMEARERQAQEVPPEDPMAQPGLAPPGLGAEAPMIPEQGVPAPSDSVGNLSTLLSQLRRPAQVAEAI
jgi:hypothetical protein